MLQSALFAPKQLVASRCPTTALTYPAVVSHFATTGLPVTSSSVSTTCQDTILADLPGAQRRCRQRRAVLHASLPRHTIAETRLFLVRPSRNGPTLNS
ncbi:hypothetical protein PAXRUDRAFT_324372 [Paxillus rubicundulus Ve08.2h10]|uniref:Uncharacterized protein n=1 Tax=Paxillus rubicundulus Ve08.2h10 TaxID=930991 RepID=A0A0D0DF07_9AGAM|nr:hypothetical protein PAXRUDRAFT_324372 [Paxillus rubicundulus Ve08.2h10]